MKGNGVFVKKVTETQSMLDTNPDLYVGYDVDPKTGQMVKKGKEGENDMSDPKLHAKDGVTDEPPKPAINVQAEAYKPGFSIGLMFEDGGGLLSTPETIKTVTSSPLKALNFIHHVCEVFPDAKLVFEDTTTGEKGPVTPAMFVKVYSKMLVSEQDKKKEQPAPMSESKTPSKAANMPLANELMNIGLVNNVKGTAKVLKEENPFRKAMEIYYASEKSNANTDEKKAEYVPSQLKEGKMTLSTKPTNTTAPEKKEEVETPKKKRPVIW